MKIKDQSQEIKEALKAGGLVICGRGSGKTKALVEIVAEDPFAVVVVGQHAQRARIIAMLMGKGYSKYQAENKTVYSVDAGMDERRFRDKAVYLDEYFMNGYRGPFFAAVSSCPFSVKFIQSEFIV